MPDVEPCHEGSLGEEAATLGEIQARLRSFVSQLDEAPSEQVMLPCLADHADSSDEEMLSPLPLRVQTRMSEPAAFVAGTAVITHVTVFVCSTVHRPYESSICLARIYVVGLAQTTSKPA